MPNSDSETGLHITNKGFQFLLQDVNTQVWAFLLQYLDMAEVIFTLTDSIVGMDSFDTNAIVADTENGFSGGVELFVPTGVIRAGPGTGHLSSHLRSFNPDLCVANLRQSKDYSVETLTETQQQMLEDLGDYGIVYRRKVHIMHSNTTTSSLPSVQTANTSFQCA
jgi:transcription initiation factor TFIIH subunit 4